MQNEQSIPTTQTAGAALPSRCPSPFLQLAAVRANRKLRIALPLPRRPSCLTRRAILFICWLAASLGIRKIRQLEPAIVFRG
jgi:hypothetical protein